MKKVSHEKNDQIILELTDKLIPLTQIARKLKKPTYYVQNRIKAMNKKNNVKPSTQNEAVNEKIANMSYSDGIQELVDRDKSEKELKPLKPETQFNIVVGQDLVDIIADRVFAQIKDRLLK